MAKNDTDQLAEMRRRYERARDATEELYSKALDDIRFVTVPGSQWDEALRRRRGDRACYEFPKLAGHTRQVINEMRQTRPQGKVRGVEEGDRGLAELMQGICRNIESVSNAEQAYDIAYETAVQGGFGVWRICTDYANDDDFELDIRIKPVRNPFAVRFDSAAVAIDRRDANWVFVEELVPEEDFKRQYPKADIQSFLDSHECARWRDKGQVRVAEYWYKEPHKRELWAVESANGTSVVFADELGLDEADLAEAGLRIVKRRTVDSHKVFMRLTNGHEFLTVPYEFPSKFIPVIPVWGNIQNIEGEDYWQGMVRPSKDQQRLHNVHRTATVEAVAKAPKAPFILKMKWIKGLERFWNRANADDFPYLPVHDEADELPKRAQQAEVPAALIQLAAMDNDDIKAATGQHNPSMGQQSNATSGRAINALKMQGATATYNYVDNLVYAIRYQYEILVDMIPRVYDTPRVVRLLGEDGGEKWKQLYQEVVDPETGQPRVVNDIRKGKYDVVVTVGPAYATQRMEAAEAFTQLAGQLGTSVPQLTPLIVYQAINNLDAPGAEEVSTALRKMLVAQGLLPPKEGDEQPQPQQPDPKLMADIRALLARAMRDEATAQKTAAEAQVVLPQAQADIEATQAKGMRDALDFILRTGGQPPMPDLRSPSLPPVGAQPIQPPQGGFFMPEQGPQFTG